MLKANRPLPPLLVPPARRTEPSWSWLAEAGKQRLDWVRSNETDIRSTLDRARAEQRGPGSPRPGPTVVAFARFPI